MQLTKVLGAGLLGTCLGISSVQAKVPADKANELGGDKYTCLGAEKAGTESGVAEYTGKWYKKWPGVTKDHGYVPSPYDDEKPLFTITASNMAEYADKLTEGQKGMFEKYPDVFKMHVYPSHRDFKFVDWTCDIAKKNAVEAEIIDDGLGVSGTGGVHPFPFPQNGLEAIWNVINPHRAWTEKSTYDIADVYENGTIAWGRSEFKTMNMCNNPEAAERCQYTDQVNAYFFVKTLLPARSNGEVSVGYQPNNFKSNATQAWQYQPGIRRVRKAPEVGFDYPVPPAGLRTVDDDYIFNGSPERYNWKLVGKKEIYVPYNNFKINDPALSYDELIKPKTINPEYMRYELHRVWVLEGYLKDGVRHIYKKRRIYADEDTWLALIAESYDNQDVLWRVNWVAYFYSQESGTYHRGVSLYHNLTSGAYEATYLVNQAGEDWWRINTELKKQEFSPQAAARAGQ
ncbi:MAG: DUF1329 domain-containing protein [Nevskiales bacterium]